VCFRSPGDEHGVDAAALDGVLQGVDELRAQRQAGVRPTPQAAAQQRHRHQWTGAPVTGPAAERGADGLDERTGELAEVLRRCSRLPAHPVEPHPRPGRRSLVERLQHLAVEAAVPQVPLALRIDAAGEGGFDVELVVGGEQPGVAGELGDVRVDDEELAAVRRRARYRGRCSVVGLVEAGRRVVGRSWQ
jgi:hypothetical protein